MPDHTALKEVVKQVVRGVNVCTV